MPPAEKPPEKPPRLSDEELGAEIRRALEADAARAPLDKVKETFEKPADEPAEGDGNGK